MAEDTGSVPTGNPDTPAPIIDPAPAPAPDPAPAPTPDDSVSFLDSVQDNDLKGWAENKQFPGVEQALNSYRNLEKLFGADKAGNTVTLLGDEPTPEQTNEFYGKLGRPETSTEYGLVAPEGDETGFADWASSTFHDIGLTSKQAAGLAEKWETYMGERQQGVADAAQISAVDAKAELKKEWGAAYDKIEAGIDQAAQTLGLTETHLTNLRTAMGPVESMKFIHGLNTKLGDDSFESGPSVDSEVMTPAQAQTETNRLLGDKEFTAAWMDKAHPGHVDAVARKARLARLIAGEAA